MANDAWRKAWSDPSFAEQLKGSAIWQQYEFLGRPYQVAIEIIEAMDKIGSYASYNEIGKYARMSPMTVSQCINCLAHAGYPFGWNQLKEARVERGQVTGRSPRGVIVGETAAETAIAILEPFAVTPEKYDGKWKSDLHYAIEESIKVLSA